jgi:hypothetical protein
MPVTDRQESHAMALRPVMVAAVHAFDQVLRKPPKPVPLRSSRSLQYLPAPRSPPVLCLRVIPTVPLALPLYLRFVIQLDALHQVYYRHET